MFQFMYTRTSAGINSDIETSLSLGPCHEKFKYTAPHSLSFKVPNQNVNRKQAWYKQSNCFLNEGSVTFYCCLWLLSKSLNRSRGFCFGLFSITNNKITVASVKKTWTCSLENCFVSNRFSFSRMSVSFLSLCSFYMF